MATKTCNHCLQEKDEEEFNWRYKALGVRSRACRECMVEFNRKYYQGTFQEKHLEQVKERKKTVRETARDFVLDYLQEHPCEECGETDVRVLEFHHVGQKDKAIVTLVSGGYSVERIQEEIAKCQVLCANCHRRITVEERGWYRRRR